MPIWFNVKEAYDHLMKYGFVYTLRPNQRKEKDGWTELCTKFEKSKHTGRKVLVTFIGRMRNNMKDFKPYVPFSGFKDLASWLGAAGDSRFLYRVETEDFKERHLPRTYSVVFPIKVEAYSEEQAVKKAMGHLLSLNETELFEIAVTEELGKVKPQQARG